MPTLVQIQPPPPDLLLGVLIFKRLIYNECLWYRLEGKKYARGRRIKAITPAFQAGDVGSIPTVRSSKVIKAVFVGLLVKA